MARLSHAELLRPFWAVARDAPSARRSWDVPPDLIACVTDELRRAGYDISRDVEEQLANVADEYALARSTASWLGKPGRERQLLRKLRDGGDVQVILDAMAPEFLVELAQYLTPADAAWALDPEGQPEEVIPRVRIAAAAFLINYRPSAGRAADVVLETAVRALVALLAPLVGDDPKVRLNKPNGTGPAPGCAASGAIEQLLKGIEPTLYPPAVLNMILKVGRQPEPTEDPMAVLLRANPVNALGASLLPGRAEAIARLRADPINGFA